METETQQPKEFTVGDIVVLKSGGPRMTLFKIEADACECVWFRDFAGGEYVSHIFLKAALCFPAA